MTLQKFLHDFAPFVDITYNTGISFLILLLSFIISAFLASRLRAPFNIFVQEFKVASKIALGFRVIPPAGTYARLAPRSGLAVKHCINVGAGVIDPDYTGEVKVVLFNHGM